MFNDTITTTNNNNNDNDNNNDDGNNNNTDNNNNNDNNNNTININNDNDNDHHKTRRPTLGNRPGDQTRDKVEGCLILHVRILLEFQQPMFQTITKPQ